MSKLFFVWGAEGSGTRLCTQMLISMGCKGEATHAQKFDRTPPQGELAVWRCSWPHADKWPNADKLVKAVKNYYNEIIVLVTVRDFFAQIHSGAKHVAGNLAEARKRTREAYPRIFKAIEKHRLPWYMISYENVVTRGELWQRRMADELGLSVAEKIDVYDGNRQWYRAIENTVQKTQSRRQIKEK